MSARDRECDRRRISKPASESFQKEIAPPPIVAQGFTLADSSCHHALLAAAEAFNVRPSQGSRVHGSDISRFSSVQALNDWRNPGAGPSPFTKMLLMITAFAAGSGDRARVRSTRRLWRADSSTRSDRRTLESRLCCCQLVMPGLEVRNRRRSVISLTSFRSLFSSTLRRCER
jgi:hypothetical protein